MSFIHPLTSLGFPIAFAFAGKNKKKIKKRRGSECLHSIICARAHTPGTQSVYRRVIGSERSGGGGSGTVERRGKECREIYRRVCVCVPVCAYMVKGKFLKKKGEKLEKEKCVVLKRGGKRK